MPQTLPPLADPRLEPDFDASRFPTCDGKAAPPVDADDPVSLKMRHFAAAYYRLNVLYTRLREIRTGKIEGDIPTLTGQIQSALAARDVIEDVLAPEGFIGEPEMEGLITVNLNFSHARRHQQAAHDGPSSSSFSIFISLEDLKHTPLRELVLQQLGLFPAEAKGGRKPAGKAAKKSADKAAKKAAPKTAKAKEAGKKAKAPKAAGSRSRKATKSPKAPETSAKTAGRASKSQRGR